MLLVVCCMFPMVVRAHFFGSQKSLLTAATRTGQDAPAEKGIILLISPHFRLLRSLSIRGGLGKVAFAVCQSPIL